MEIRQGAQPPARMKESLPLPLPPTKAPRLECCTPKKWKTGWTAGTPHPLAASWLPKAEENKARLHSCPTQARSLEEVFVSAAAV